MIIDNDYKPEDDLEFEDSIRIQKRGVKDIFEDEISEPEIMIFCKGDHKSTELLSLYSKMAKLHEYDQIINHEMRFEENTETDVKSNFVRNFYLGVSYFKKKEYEEALKHFLEANKTFKYYQLYYNIGLCYLNLDNLESAVYYFDTVTKENKNNIFAFYNLIKIFLKQKNFNDAYLLYHEFIEITKKENQEPGSNYDVGRLSGTPIHYIKIFYKIGAYCCFAKSLYQECIHTILEGLKFNPDDPDLWCLYAKVYIIKKIYNFAIPLLERALDLDPEHRESQELLEIVVHLAADD